MPLWVVPLVWGQSNSTAPAPGPLVLYRSLYLGRQDAQAQVLMPGQQVTLTGQRLALGNLNVAQARLRIASPDPAVLADFKFVPLPRQAGLTLTVVILTRVQGAEYQMLEQGQQVQGGNLVPQERFQVSPNPQGTLETELASSELAAPLRAIVLQDDGQAELRLRQEGQTLVLTVVPPHFGGEPSGLPYPYYRGESLRLLDYTVLLGGYAGSALNSTLGGGGADSAFAEAWFWKTLLLRLNAFSDKRETQSLARLVVAQQAYRQEHWSLWLEGGGAAYAKTLAAGRSTSLTTWSAGATLHVRFQDWGGAVHVAAADTVSVVELLGSWQATRRLGLVLSYQALQDQSGPGVGLSFAF